MRGGPRISMTSYEDCQQLRKLRSAHLSSTFGQRPPEEDLEFIRRDRNRFTEAFDVRLSTHHMVSEDDAWVPSLFLDGKLRH